MNVISTIFGVLCILIIFTLPILFIIFIVQLIRKKKAGFILIAMVSCFWAFCIFVLAGTLTSPQTYCDHQFAEMEKQDATCTEDGYVTKHCTLCGLDETETIEKTGHKMEITSKTEATEESNGEIIRTCSICGYSEVETIPKLPSTEPESIPEPELESKEEPSVIELSVEEPSKEESSEDVSVEESSEEESHEHEWEEIHRIEPTEDQEGVVEYKCSICGETKNEYLEKLEKEVTYQDIFKDYEKNSLRADEEYKGNYYRVTGEVYTISSYDFLSEKTIILGLYITYDSRHTICTATFKPNQADALKKINTGDIISFWGKCDGQYNWEDCILLEE